MSACRKCGCTNLRACPGGCYWVEPDLCSACVPDAERARIRNFEAAAVRLQGISRAQQRALSDLVAGEFTRSREGWKTQRGRFVPLIVVAKLRQRGLVILGAKGRTASLTLAAKPVIEQLANEHRTAAQAQGGAA